jgi:hypothetical protein
VPPLISRKKPKKVSESEEMSSVKLATCAPERVDVRRTSGSLTGGGYFFSSFGVVSFPRIDLSCLCLSLGQIVLHPDP